MNSGLTVILYIPQHDFVQEGFRCYIIFFISFGVSLVDDETPRNLLFRVCKQSEKLNHTLFVAEMSKFSGGLMFCCHGYSGVTAPTQAGLPQMVGGTP